MNTPNRCLEPGTGALRGALSASKRSPRPIPCPETGPTTVIGDRR
jgi:hypothetical protein